MNKQLLSILSIILSIALGLGIYLYFFEIGEKKVKPLFVVPENAAIVLESNKSSQMLQAIGDPQFMEKLMKNEEIELFYNQLILLDSIFKSNSTLGNWFESGEAVYSFHAFKNKQVGFFMAVQTTNETDGQKVMKFINTIFPGRYQLTTRKFYGENVYDFNDFGGDNSFSIAFKSKLMMFSFDGSLVENALLKLRDNSPDVQMNEKNHYIFNGNKDFNVYLNYQYLPLLIKSFSNNDEPNAFNTLGTMAEKGFYQVEISDKDLIFKGASITSDKNFQFLDLLNSQAPTENKVVQFLPENTAFCFNFSLNGYEKWYPNLKEYLFSEGLYRAYENYSDSIESIFGKGLNKKLSSYLGAQAGISAVIEPGINKDSSYIVYFELNNPLGFKSLMNEIQSKYQSKNGGDSTLISSLDSTHRIFPFYLGDYPKVLFGNLFDGLNLNSFTIKGNYVFLSAHPSCLNGLIRNWQEGNLLQKSERFKDFREKMVGQSNLELFINADIAPKYALNFVNESWYGILTRNMGTFRKAGFIAMQFGGSTDKTFASQFTIEFNTGKTDKTEKIWEIPLDTLMESNPVSVYSSKIGEQVLLVMDKKHQLYAISKSGMILWKYQVEDELVSGIEEIDMYKNGKHQYVFNTSHNIHIVDENGKAMQAWPAWIPTSTTFPISIIELNEEKQLGFFTVGKFYKLSAYNSQARFLPVWNPMSIYPNIISELYPVKLSGIKQVWALNEKGKLSGFDLSGKILNPLFNDSSYTWKNILINQVDTGSLQIIASDSNIVYSINYHTNKPIEIKQIFKSESGISKINYYQDKASGLIQIKMLNETKIIDLKGKSVYTKLEPDSIISNKYWKPFNNKIKSIWYNKSNGLIQVDDDKSGKTEPFPIQSNGNFTSGDLFKDQDNYIIFGSNSNSILLYRIK